MARDVDSYLAGLLSNGRAKATANRPNREPPTSAAAEAPSYVELARN
jgi:hypothetical protein